MPTEVQGPAMFGTKPFASNWNTLGKGPTEAPSSTASVSPRNTSMPARVTIKDGMRK